MNAYEDVPNEKTESIDQQFQGFEEEILEKEPLSKGLFKLSTF